MNRIQFAFALVIVLVGLTALFAPELDRPIITSRELAAVVAAILVIIGVITVYNAIYRTKN
ncbi:MAG: hypothetical protein NWF06_04430 [Candidatus Bathyarchaeota archaeon]|nr:hypothetical protein [Candidatus Bathyarchaeum sp.]